MLYNVTQIKKDIHWLMEQVKCLIKNQDSSSNTINQNNVFRSISLSTTEDVSETVVANYINGLPSFTIGEIELLTITVIKITEDHSVTYKYLLINTGKGTYGQTGFLIDSSNLLLIYEKELVSGDVEDLDTTQIITFSFVAVDVSTTLNNYTPPFLIQNQADGYVLFKTSEGNYLFLAEGGLYGDGELQTTMADFQLLAEDVLPITNTSQLVNDGATGVSTYTEKTYVDALVAAEAVARDDADDLIYDFVLGSLADKEDVSNKTGTVIGNEASTSLYLHIAGMIAHFQEKLTSGTNIKTVNGTSLLGSGNLNTPDMNTTTAQSVSGVKTFLAGMLGLRNTANTFTSFFASAVTASRIWTFPDKAGTVAMTSDIVDKLSGGVSNYLVKFNSATTGTLSRLFDNGNYFGIGVVNTPTKDITLGNQSAKSIGVEDSESTAVGMDLIITAGRTLNYVINTSYVKLTQLITQPKSVEHSPTGDMYLTFYTSPNIFKQVAGTGNFSSFISAPFNLMDLSENINNDLYVVAPTADIYVRLGNAGAFVAVGTGLTGWTSISCAPNGDVYATRNGDIYKRALGVGSFVALGQTSRAWSSIACAYNGDVYAAAGTGDIYKRTGGTGNFIGLSQTNRNWRALACSPNGNIYATENNNGTYKQTNGVGNFIFDVSVGTNYFLENNIAVSKLGNVYIAEYNAGIYMQNNAGLGTANLDGGYLKMKAGTGKGTGKSRVQIITGQKGVSGTDMQVEVVRAEFYEDGNYKRIGTPVYADNTAALAGGLTAGMEYRTATGVKMEVY